METKGIEWMFAVIYEDDGPSGMCGQSTLTTSPWKRLYLFKSESKMRKFLQQIESSKGRMNSRVSYVFYSDEMGGNNEINFVSETVGEVV